MAADTRPPRDVSWVQKLINRFKMRRDPESGPGEVGGARGTSRAACVPTGGGATLDHFVEYKAYRIHTRPHLAGLWISMLVRIGTPKPVTKDSLTDTVTRVPGEYPSEAEAQMAATQYIDHLEGRE